jgi:hypothetical protein
MSRMMMGAEPTSKPFHLSLYTHFPQFYATPFIDIQITGSQVESSVCRRCMSVVFTTYSYITFASVSIEAIPPSSLLFSRLLRRGGRLIF